MYSTTVYLYQQITRVLLVNTDGGYFISRYNLVYAKSLTINKGVDNVLLFEFINQDQKPVNITGSTFVFRAIAQDGSELLIEKPCQILSAALGRVKVVLDVTDTINVQAQPASYSIERTSGNYVQAVYVNADSQARADCNIVDSVLPEFQPSAVCTVPDMYGKNQFVGTAPTSYPDWALNPQPINSIHQTEFYSSHMPTTGAAATTIKFDLTHYTGTVKVQAAQNYESVWYDVSETREYLDQTVIDHFNIVGYHPLLRLALNNSVGYGASATVTVVDGEVTQVTLNNPGVNYVAAPYVQILGNGSGAIAQAVLGSNGTLSGVDVITSGTGYLPVQFQGGVAATAFFSNGKIENVQYR